MAAFVFLGIGLLCGLIGRGLLVHAAFQASVWWGIGVFFPFGPLFFRLSYPEEARRARSFQLATLPCFFFYILLGPGPDWARSNHAYLPKTVAKLPAAHGYAMEPQPKEPVAEAPASPTATPPNLDERRLANARELERLRVWNETLRLRKRDILKSDVEGSRAFNRDATEYNVALEKANAEKTALASVAK